jgi:signal recognition particle receptor subunit beta
VALFNYTTMQATAKIVYYGPGLCGKTTNLQYIHLKTAAQSRGEMVSLETETDRTLFFDLLPLEVGIIGGMKVRLQLYTVPGQVFYNATRKLVLKGVDGVVFVADSQGVAREANVESLRNLEANLREQGLSLEDVPVVFQFNKRDIRQILSVDELNDTLNPGGAPFFEAAALHGIGVFETLKAISRMALASVRKKIAWDTGRKAPVEMPAAAPPPGAMAPAEPVASAPPAADDGTVEFAEEETGTHAVRPVRTRERLDIHDELEKLRAMALGPGRAARQASKEAGSRLTDMLVSQRDSRQEVKRKATVEVPAHFLKSASALKIHLAFDDEEAVVKDAVTVRLIGNKKLERLTLHLDLELKGKS